MLKMLKAFEQEPGFSVFLNEQHMPGVNVASDIMKQLPLMAIKEQRMTV